MKSLKEMTHQNKLLSVGQKTHINIVFTSNYIDHNLEKILNEFGLDLPQFNILQILNHPNGEPVNIKDIQKRMIHKMANTSRLIKSLEDKALIFRTPSEKDKRVVNVALSEKGKIVLEQLEDLTHRYHLDQFSNLTKEEVIELNFLLDKIRK